MSENETPTTPPAKPGKTTSEFWVTAIVTVVSLATMIGWVTPETVNETVVPWVEVVAKIAAGLVAALTAGTYTVARTKLKQSS